MAITFNISALILVFVVLILLSMFLKLKTIVIKLLTTICGIILFIMLAPEIANILQNVL